MGELSNGPIQDPHVPLTPKPGGGKAPFEITGKRFGWAIELTYPRPPRTQKGGVANRRPQI